MSITKTIGTLAHGAVSTAVSAARLPLSTASMAAGLVKGTAESGLGLVRDVVGAGASAVPTQRQDSQQREETSRAGAASTEVTQDGPAEPQVVPKPVPDFDDLPEPIVIQGEGEPGEAFHTEPKAASRDSEHGGPAGDREEVEGYVEEIPEDLAPTTTEESPVWTSESSDPVLSEEAGLDDPIAKAVLSEAEILRKAAETHKE